MARPIGDKPLSEPTLTQFTDAYMQHKGEMCLEFVLTKDTPYLARTGEL